MTCLPTSMRSSSWARISLYPEPQTSRRTVIAIFPHMHQVGTHFKAEIERGGNTITLWDDDFQFESQEFAVPVQFGRRPPRHPHRLGPTTNFTPMSAASRGAISSIDIRGRRAGLKPGPQRMNEER